MGEGASNSDPGLPDLSEWAPQTVAPPPKSRDMLDLAKDWLSLFQSLATILALLAGGWWFWEQRMDKPRLKVEHRISHRRTSSNEQLLIVDVLLSNVGNTKVDPPCGKIRVYEIIPDHEKLVNPDDTCNEDRVSLEPAEADQVHEEYAIKGDVKTVRVYTFFANPSNPELGWSQTSFYDLIDAVKVK
jgi:hypothetical protein